MPLTFIHFDPKSDKFLPTHHTLSSYRDRVRSEVRNDFNQTLQLLTGIESACMSYSPGGYAGMVAKYHWLFDGWPPHIPFANLSDLTLSSILAISALWCEGKLRFVPATQDDLINAALNPRGIHPNPVLLDKQEARCRAREAATLAAPTVVSPAVLHPGTLNLLGFLPTSTRPGTSTLGKRARMQRSNVKRPHMHGRALKAAAASGTSGGPSGTAAPALASGRRRVKRGVTSEPYVIEDDDKPESEVEDFEEPPRKRGRIWLVRDPLLSIQAAASGGGKSSESA
ncbi:hypothetical protein C8Q78DRAFT_993973 [Trametes maxima]|nr:hypothetical protein C8Q78DRAFT_1081963 [Trametes maxima]KAI0667653.1 hypothetical protein C8Q78DRAFT_993973 [Trametes maxima]